MSEKKPLLSVEDALAAILATAKPLGVEEVPLAQTFGRTLARDLVALRTQPPKNLSAMDGYALRAADVGRALTVIGESSAGAGFAGVCGPGEAVRIFTGAPLPQGADSVLVQEDATRDGDLVSARTAVSLGKNVRVAGVDFHEGETILPAGRRLTPADVAFAASADHPILPVARRPKIAVLSTGDELVPPGEQRGPDQIVASNAYAVLGLIAACGGEAIDLGVTPDQPEAIEAAIRNALAMNIDVLVTIGGASVGDRDFVRGALSREGMALEFWKINMKPGKPLIHGHIGATKVLGLPGNPVSAVVCGELFLKPLIRALCGEPAGHRLDPAVAGADLKANGPRREYMRATLAWGEDGRLVATPQKDQDSSLNSVLARSHALILREANAPAVARGAELRVLRLTE
ncbi:molybdopterin molybdotransferase [Rhodoblastus acidophilus]|uniref:molybdopterin molybdotransferase MoeA n=1 Tax=Rhodoblastus acidophilus TaxID=1074 RepID=UPI002224C007|nr:gephyrin-like molybdotransferase Glp [Rhodoblastus acidophilus]MCW2283128.1 molybdopterin molybdotransferase [Rhodoblastus acidophilus]MCW2331821.1 molybdopterin molybdotransferase [Rhodoblastus acidophilus]